MFNDDDYALTPEEMKLCLRVTRARIEVIEKKALRRLARYALLKDLQTRDTLAVLFVLGVLGGGYAD